MFRSHRGCLAVADTARRQLPSGCARLSRLRTQPGLPDQDEFDYTFDHIASVIDDFTQALGLLHYTLYMQDYGGPIGFRLALAHPERCELLIVQDAVAHNEGLGANWATRRAFWRTGLLDGEALRKNLLLLATTKTRHWNDPRSSSMTRNFGPMSTHF